MTYLSSEGGTWGLQSHCTEEEQRDTGTGRGLVVAVPLPEN